MEDIFFTVRDYLKLYNQNDKIIKYLKKSRNGTINIFGAGYKTKTQLKLMNHFDFYNVAIQTHLVKITDTNMNVRDLLHSMLNTKENRSNNQTNGKILEDDQYSDPNTEDKANKITMNFETSLKCQLTDSTKFKDQAKIVHTWVRVLTLKSIWELTLEHHLGEGLHPLETCTLKFLA
nr:hypothetical protein [Naviculales sp.]